MPGTMSAFAEAYQKMNDGNLQGQEAIAMFLKDMGDGKISSSKIMPYVGTILSERSQSKLGIMKQSSMAEVARYQNVRDDQIQKFGKAGGESGLARIWWSITEAIKETTGEMEFLGRVWDKVSKGFATAILIPQSIKRMFDGRDSLVKDWLVGMSDEQTVDSLIESVKTLGSEFKKTFDLGKEGWKSLFNLAEENDIASIYTHAAKELMDYLSLTLKSIQIAAEPDTEKKALLIEQAAGIASKTMVHANSEMWIEDNPEGMWVKGSKLLWQWPTLFFGGNEEYSRQVKNAEMEYIQDGHFTGVNKANFIEKNMLAENINEKLKAEKGFNRNVGFSSIQEALNTGITSVEDVVNYISSHNTNLSSGSYFYEFSKGKGLNQQAFTEQMETSKKQMVDLSKNRLSQAYDGVESLDYDKIMELYWEVTGSSKTMNVMDLNDFIQNNYKDSIERKVDEEGNPVIDNKSLQELLDGVSSNVEISNTVTVQPAQVTINLTGVENTEDNAKSIGEAVAYHIQNIVSGSMVAYTV